MISLKQKLGRGRWDLAFCQIAVNSVQKFQRKSQKCLSQSEARAAILFFFWSARNTKPLKRTLWSCFLSSFVEFRTAVSESKKTQPIRDWRGHLVFSISSKKRKLGRKRWDLASCQFAVNSVQKFQRESKIWLSQSEDRVAILFFTIGPEQNRWRGLCDLASCQVSFSSVQQFQQRS